MAKEPWQEDIMRIKKKQDQNVVRENKVEESLLTVS